MKKSFFIFGQEVPKSVIAELISNGYKEEEITNDMLETLFWYDYQDEC